MKKALIAFIFPLFLFSCLSAPPRDAGVQDATADVQAVSEAMVFQPSADALFFRFDLVRDQIKEYVGEPSEPKLFDADYAVFGCYFGNGLTVDSNGNVYLDPVKVFGIDPKGRFKMKHGLESIERTDDGYKMKGFRDGVIQLESAALNDRGWIKVKSGGLVARNLQLDETGTRGVCARGLVKEKMTATEKEIRVSGALSGQSAFTRNGDIVEFAGQKKVKVEQRGDTYGIKITEMFFFISQSSVEYELSFLEDRIVFMKAGRTVFDLVKRSDGLYDRKTGTQVLSISRE